MNTIRNICTEDRARTGDETMKEKQEFMKQFMQEFEEKMNTKFNRSEDRDSKAVAKRDIIQDGIEKHESEPIEEKIGRTLKILVDSSDGDKVRVNLPLKLGRTLLSKGSKLSGRLSETLDEEDLDMVMDMIDKGHIGEIVNVSSAEGDTVVVKVE